MTDEDRQDWTTAIEEEQHKEAVRRDVQMTDGERYQKRLPEAKSWLVAIREKYRGHGELSEVFKAIDEACKEPVPTELTKQWDALRPVLQQLVADCPPQALEELGELYNAARVMRIVVNQPDPEPAETVKV